MVKNYKLIGCVLIVIFFCVGVIFALRYIQSIWDQRFVQPIPKELGINSWDDFHNYVNKTFVEGMSREEMYEELEKFGEYRITPPRTSGSTGTYCYIVGLPIGQPVDFHRQEYLACFSENDDILVRWTFYN